MKRLLTAALLAFLLALPTFSYAKLDLTERVKLSLVHVSFQVSVEPPAVHLCTGFVADAAKGLVLTARHCVTDGQNYVDDQASELRKVSDQFALLSIPSMSKPPLDIRKKNASYLEQVYAYGYPWDGSILVALTRHVAAFKDGDFGMDGPFGQGMSGGPIVDEDGKVVGMIQASNELIGIACSAAELQAFLKAK